MVSPFPSTLATARTVVRGLIVLNLALGAGILALFVASLVARDQVFAALGADVANATVASAIGCVSSW